MEYPDSTLKKLFSKIKEYKYYYAGIIAVLFALVLTQIAAADLVRRLLNVISIKNMQSLVTVIMLSLLNYLIYSIAFFFDGFLSFILNQKLTIKLQKELFSKISSLSYKNFMGYNSGDLVARLTQNIPSTFRLLNSCIINFIYALIMFISILVYMFWINTQMSLLILVFYIPIPFIITFFTKNIKKAYKNAISSNKITNSFTMEILNNSIVIRVFKSIAKMNFELLQKERTLLNANVKTSILSDGMENIIMLLLRIGEALIVYGLGGWLYYSGKIEIGDVFAIMNIFLTLISPIRLLSNIAGNYQGAKENAKVIYEILDFPETDQAIKQSDNENINQVTDSQITFSHVSYKYDKLDVLKDVSFQIQPGEKVLITGANGIGKSTLIQLILGILTPDAGQVLLGKHDINKISPEKLSRQFAYIPQRSTLLYGNILENVALGLEEYDQEEIEEVLAKMNLTGLIERIPEYHKSQLVNPKINVSDGEKQRISIARALIKSIKTNIVIGDEIFSNIDYENKNKIIIELVKEWKDKTVILINHDEINFPFNKRIELSETNLTITEDLEK